MRVPLVRRGAPLWLLGAAATLFVAALEPLRAADSWDAAFAGLPRLAAADEEITVLLNRGFIVGYSDGRRNPLWVCYRVFYV
ncbi:MAG TPA: hypothetical protein ENN53_03425 [Candidatus Acetothermia bacterium]|nr:hypothetical protein [Candidatus Acetothermia bacterium]